MKTSVMLALVLVLVMPTTVQVQSPLPKDGSGTTTVDDTGSLGVDFRGAQIVNDAAGSYLFGAILLVQGVALAFVLWKLLGRSQGQGATLRRAFTCPLRGQEVIAEFELDVAERPIDVVWCTAFRPPVVTECRKQCLSEQSVLPGARGRRLGKFGVLHAAGRHLSPTSRKS